MTKHVQSTNLTQTWNIDANDDTWILAKSAKITVSDESAIYVASNYSGNTVRINGDIDASGMVYGVHVAGPSTTVEIGADARVDITGGIAVGFNSGTQTLHNAGIINSDVAGVLLAFAKGDITNTGTIQGGQAAVAGSEGMSLTNSGKLLGTDFAVGVDALDSTVINLEAGIIKADQIAITVERTGSYEITNDGLISGASAIVDDDGDGKIINRGTIDGNVYLGTNPDSFDTRKGVLHGKVFGGDGDDIFTLNNQSLKIVEKFDEGRDTVRSTVDYVLGSYLENLQLLGSGNTKATGNALDNLLAGNKGDNILKGLSGYDILAGFGGNDRLLGGGGEDSFVFNENFGHDVIGDFADGVDVISSTYADSQAEIDALLADHVKVSGKDLLIDFGDDTLLIRNMAKADLTADDF